MKRSLLFIIILSGFFSAAESFAQNTADTVLPRILYTNSERTAIIGKTKGWNKVDTVYKSAVGKNGNYVTVKNIAVLASTKDGNSLLISCRTYFFNPLNGAGDSMWAVLKIDAPFVNSGAYNPLTTPPSLGGAKILLSFTIDDANTIFNVTAGKMMSLGVLSPDENSWYFTPNKTAGVAINNQWFFHGNNFKGPNASVVDTLYVGDHSVANSAEGGYHMTNLVTNSDGTAMYAVIFDELDATFPRAQVLTWTPNVTSGGINHSFGDISAAINGAITPRPNPNWNIDNSFAFVLHAVPLSSPALLQLGLVQNAAGDINLYEIRASGSISSINDAGNYIRKTNMPKDTAKRKLAFFTGRTGNPGNADDGKEVIAPGTGFPLGNGGDMMFAQDTDLIVFVTCDSSLVATNGASGIYTYDIASGKIDSIMNDRNEMERQPIFTKSVIHKYVKITPPPPTYIPGKAITDSSKIDFGVDSIGFTPVAQSIVTLTDTSKSMVILKSAVIGGNNAGVFALLSLPKFLDTVQSKMTQTFTITFTPAVEQTYTATLQIIYTDTLGLNEHKTDSTINIPITGTGIKKKTQGGGGGVASSAPLSFDLSIVPNPFTSSTQITISAREAGKSTLEIRDLLGKEIYATHTLSLSTGEKYTYNLDANTLHLAPGTYFVIVRSDGQELTRQAIYVK